MKNIWKTIKYINRLRNIKTNYLKDKIKLFLICKGKGKLTKLDINNYNSVIIPLYGKGIGDIIVISGFIDVMRKQGKTIYVITEEKLTFLFKTSLIEVDGYFEHELNAPPTLLKNKLRNDSFDLMIDFYNLDHNIVKRTRNMFAINVQHTIGFNQPRHNIFDTNIIYNEEKHISDRMITVLKKLGVYVDQINYQINIPKIVQSDIGAFINENSHKLIIFNPFAGNIHRSMSKEQIHTILNYLDTQSDYKTVVFDTDNIIDFSKYNQVINNPFKSFVSACELTKNAKLVISVDTSIVHVANAFKTPLIAIYNNRIVNGGQKNNIVWAPNYSKAKQLYTSQYLNTGKGDYINSFDVNILINEIESKLTTLYLY